MSNKPEKKANQEKIKSKLDSTIVDSTNKYSALPNENFGDFSNAFSNDFSKKSEGKKEKETDHSHPHPTAKVWLTVRKPNESQKIDLEKLYEGQTIGCAVPQNSFVGDYVFMWVAGGTGLKYILKETNLSEDSTRTNDSGIFPDLKVIKVLKYPVQFSAFKKNKILGNWVYVKRRMQGIIGQQSKSFVDDPEIWNAFKNLLIKTNPDTKKIITEIEKKCLFSTKKSLVDVKGNFNSDAPTREDYLGYRNISKALSSFLLNKKTCLPLSFAIDASWGSGKSSVMQMLASELEKNGSKEIDKDDKVELLESRKITWNDFFKQISSYESDTSEIEFNSGKQNESKSQSENEQRKFLIFTFNAWRYGVGDKLTASLVHHILNKYANSKSLLEREKFWLKINLKRMDFDQIRRNFVFKTLLNSAVGGGLLVLGVLILLCLYKTYAPTTPIAVAVVLYGFYNHAIVKKLTDWIGWFKFSKNKVSLDMAKHIKSPDYFKLMGPQFQIEKDFKYLVEEMEVENKSLLIFIDDLDRCSPKQIVDVVETINVFFGQKVKNCVFVLGMHSSLVAKSIELAYKDLAKKIEEHPVLKEELPYGRRFLEKIVQFVVHLPEPEDKNIDKYIKHLISSGDKNENKFNGAEFVDEKRKIIGDFESLYENKTSEEMDEEGKNEFIKKAVSVGFEEEEAEYTYKTKKIEKNIAAFDENDDEVLNIFNLVKNVLKRNPRQYVRFFNTLRFFYRLESYKKEEKLTPDELLLLAKKSVISLEWPDIWSFISKNDEKLHNFMDSVEIGNGLEEQLKNIFGLPRNDSDDEQSVLIKNYVGDGRLKELLMIDI